MELRAPSCIHSGRDNEGADALRGPESARDGEAAPLPVRVRGRLGRGLGAARPRPRPCVAQAGPHRHQPSAPEHRACMGHGWLWCLSEVCGGHGVRMAKAASSASAEPETGSSFRDGPRVLEKLSHGLVRAPPSSSPPRSPEERPVWHRPARFPHGPRLPNPPPMRPQQTRPTRFSGRQTQNGGGICSNHSLSATET